MNIGDHNKDGVTDIAVGAMQEGYFYDSDGNGGYDYQMSKGGVYLLHMNTNGSVKESFRINEDTENGPDIGHGHNQWYGQFGSSIEAVDINNDLKLELVVGASSDKET